MSNPLNAGMQQQQQQVPDLNMLYKQFAQNPMKYLTGLNIPQGMNSPQQIVQFLQSNGRIPPQLQPYVNLMLAVK